VGAGAAATVRAPARGAAATAAAGAAATGTAAAERGSAQAPALARARARAAWITRPARLGPRSWRRSPLHLCQDTPAPQAPALPVQALGTDSPEVPKGWWCQQASGLAWGPAWEPAWVRAWAWAHFPATTQWANGRDVRPSAHHAGGLASCRAPRPPGEQGARGQPRPRLTSGAVLQSGNTPPLGHAAGNNQQRPSALHCQNWAEGPVLPAQPPLTWCCGLGRWLGHWLGRGLGGGDLRREANHDGSAETPIQSKTEREGQRCTQRHPQLAHQNLVLQRKNKGGGAL
jgi:hypothetical protein